MPDQEVHVYIDKWFLGKSYWKIHREMDRPHKRLGRRHRILFHDPATAISIAQRLYPNDPLAIRAALLHITIDNICSRNPEFRETLEIAARLDRRKKRRKRKRKLSYPPVYQCYYSYHAQPCVVCGRCGFHGSIAWIPVGECFMCPKCGTPYFREH